MGAPTVHYELMPGSYEFSGDVRSGLRAKADFLVAWVDAFQFAKDILVAPKAVRVGLITWSAPWQFPVSFGGFTPPIYAQSFSIKPMGASSGSEPPTKGLAPGEYYSKAVITVNFESVSCTQGLPTDDPQQLAQLDPTNPITLCEQSVDINPKMVTVRGGKYEYSSGPFVAQPVDGDMAVLRNDVRITCNFPRVPYLPWELIQPYVGKVNNSMIFNCVKGSLLLEGFGTKITPMTDGTIGQTVTLKFAWNPDWTGHSPQGLDWNSFDYPDASGTAIVASVSGGVTPYTYTNFSQIFYGLQF